MSYEHIYFKNFQLNFEVAYVRRDLYVFQVITPRFSSSLTWNQSCKGETMCCLGLTCRGQQYVAKASSLKRRRLTGRENGILLTSVTGCDIEEQDLTSRLFEEIVDTLGWKGIFFLNLLLLNK